MPNWVTNKFTIKGDKKTINTIVEKYFVKNKFNELVFDFEKVIPIPIVLNEEIKEETKNAIYLIGEASKYNDMTLKEIYEKEKELTTENLLLVLRGYPREFISLYENKLKDEKLDDLVISDLLAKLRSKEVVLDYIDIKEADLLYPELQEAGYLDSYHFRLERWGCSKVGFELIYNIFDEEDKTVVEGTFDTAWSPAGGIYNELCLLHPTIELKVQYLEPGAYFGGHFTYSKEHGACETEYGNETLTKLFKENGFITDEDLVDTV